MVIGFFIIMTGRMKTNLKIIGATAVALFSLTTVFTGTLAWFAANQTVSTTGMSVKVGKTSSINILSCYAVRYDGNYGAIAYDISGGNSNITMSEYDFVFKDRNVNTPLFIRMEISNFNSEKDLIVTIPCTGTYKTNDKVDPYLSNVIGAKFLYGLKVNSSLVKDENTKTVTWADGAHTSAVVDCYNGMLAHASESSGTPFVVNDSKSNTISLSLDAEDVFDNNFIITKSDGQGGNVDVAVVYIVLDYYVVNNINLVVDYLDSYEAAEDDDYALSFTSDISTMAIENEDNL